MSEPAYYVIFHNKTAFIPFKYVYPECYVLRKDQPQVDPLHCLESDCPVDRGCMGILVKRLQYLYDNVLSEDVEMIIAYYKLPSGRIRAGVFHKDFREPNVITCNKSALAKFSKEGKTYMWVPRDEYYLLTADQHLIKPEDLLRLR